MKIVNIILVILAVVLFTGCTGKVQTNPLPTNDKINLPTNKTYGNVLEIKEIDKVDFREFVSTKVGTGTIATKKTYYKKSPYKNVKSSNSKLWNHGYQKVRK